MAEGAIQFTESSTDGESSGGRSQPRRWRQLRKRKRRRRRFKDPLEIIDLTGEDSFAGVIDLTEAEETIISPLQNGGCITEDLKHSTPVYAQTLCYPEIFTPADAEIKMDVTVGMYDRDCKSPCSKKRAIKGFYIQSNGFSLTKNYRADSESSSHTACNSDLGSLGSPQLDSDIFSSANEGSEYQAVLDYVEEGLNPCPPEGHLDPKLSLPLQKPSPSPIQPLREVNNLVPSAAKLDFQEPPTQMDIKAWLKTLQYFQGVPVHHPFLQNVVQEMRQNRQLNVQPIPHRRLSTVVSTIEENFFQGTLDFLMDYVSSQHYPPKEIITSVVKDILLNREQDNVQQEMQRDAYLLLMKIQALHPANADTVVWDWKLLRMVMEEEEENKFPGEPLFLQYVIQTLEDDFEKMAKQSLLKKSIAKTTLSCDCCFSNVREVIEWIIAAITGVRSSQHRRQQEAGSPSSETSKGESYSSTPEQHLDRIAQNEVVSSRCQTKMEVAILQKMLSIAVEVDASPNCSANKIADRIFSLLLSIPKRSQREAFLASIECDLLRCKVLELIFQHSSAPTALPLSLTKILHFLETFSVQLKYQDNEATWQRWDEMLHHLSLLFLSYRNIVLGHLRISIRDRIPLISKAVKPKLQREDYIEEYDIRCKVQSFQKHVSKILGQPIPSPILEKIELLQVLFLTAMNI
ncbi:SUMO-interacting motif-containing protein 1 isoform X1 [Pogona vitticeps]